MTGLGVPAAASRRLRWVFLLLLGFRPEPVAVGTPTPTPPAPLRQGGPPNIVWIIADDHAGGTLGIDGDPRRATPCLDRLAREGVRFTRAFCNAPICTASRQSFLTGRYPHATGVTLLATPLREETTTLAECLGRAGYATAAIGKMHFNSDGRHGFDLRLDAPDWQRSLRANPPPTRERRRPWRPFQDPAAVWLNAAVEDSGLPDDAMEASFFVRQAVEYLRRNRGRPFFLVVGFEEPHSPFHFPAGFPGRYRPDDFEAPPVDAEDRAQQPLVFRDLTTPEIRGIQAAYFSSLAFLDSKVGELLEAMDQLGLSENTIVVYLGDNGYMLGQHGRFEKHVLYEPAVRVPFLLRWPGHLGGEGGRRVDEIVELVDLFPTMLDLCGVEPPPRLDGTSLAGLLRGTPGAKGRSYVFSEYPENEEAMIRSGRYKLIVGSGRRIRQDGYLSANPLPGYRERLFDLEADPGERTDLSGRPELAATQAELRTELWRRLVTTRPERLPVPPGLSEHEAILWCLRPTDHVRPR